MPKFQMSLIVVLIGCVAFVSCERTQQVVGPIMPGEDPLQVDDMMEPSDTLDMPDMSNPSVNGLSVVINELMADNDNILADPQGDYDDWLELHNLTDSPVVLTGMYLSDKEDEPTKWAFPENTEIPANGYLIVWLDEDIDDVEGLHADFKLSKSGEIVTLVDTDGIQVLDSITFGEQATDTALGRFPDGTGEFQVVQPTPGSENMAQ